METSNQLVTELNVLGAPFLTGGDTDENLKATLPPAELLAALAKQTEARLRLAIIPLLLRRPDLASAVPEAVHRLDEPAQTTLKLFYTAAMLLQQIYGDHLAAVGVRPTEILPDLFSTELDLSKHVDPQSQLKQLAEQHRMSSGLAANWVGTYHHAAQRLLVRLEREQKWQQN